MLRPCCDWKTHCLSLLVVVAGPAIAAADVVLPALFSDHMVLQAGKNVAVWGTAEANEAVTVTIGTQSAETQATADGKWRATLKDLAAGGPRTMVVRGRNTITINDVLVGEVWLGSGQSNMAMAVRSTQNAEQEMAAADLPNIRMFTVTSKAAQQPADDCTGSWVVCDRKSVGAFSATAFYFGRELHAQLKVPVGLINSSVGGTPIESWIDAEAQRATPELTAGFTADRAAEANFDLAAAVRRYETELQAWQAAAKAARAAGDTVPRKPIDPRVVRERKGNVGGLFNGKIHPLIPYTLRGVIWYQGEANSAPDKAPLYGRQLELLITDWRRRWGDELPFAWVQLPNYLGSQRAWPIVREQMLQTLRVPKTGMAITIDIGAERDIHPKNKQDVGKRLATWALATVYERDMIASGPLPHNNVMTEGNALVVTFDHAQGLRAREGELVGFELAGNDGEWLPAKARVDGTRVIVSHAKLAEPVSVRYAWANYPTCNLINEAGFPATPFRFERHSSSK
ncbi:MAG: sialate O-acetylesterase [Planctomycetaceae bacterium]|nr:sialate O-acetylesterase [Planctomycetaceae bacterium]